MLPKCLARMRVGQVYLDEGQPRSQERIAQRDARVGKGPRVDDRERHALGAGAVHALDQLVFGVALEREQLVAELKGKRGAALLDGLQGVGAIDGRLARAEQVQVGAVQHQHSGHGPSGLLLYECTTSDAARMYRNSHRFGTLRWRIPGISPDWVYCAAAGVALRTAVSRAIPEAICSRAATRPRRPWSRSIIRSRIRAASSACSSPTFRAMLCFDESANT